MRAPALPALLTVLAAFALAGCPPPGPVPGPGPVPDVPGPIIVANPLTEPVVVSSVPQQVGSGTRRILDATLEVVYAQLQVPLPAGGTAPQYLRAYRLVSARVTPMSQDSTVFDVTAFPGPTFVVQPGDSVRIKLVNSLTNLPDQGNSECMSYPAADSLRDTMPECFHGPNWTNIHYHGFHVTPDSLGDDVLLQIQPGRTFQYAFGIPLNQSPGTHWYHPHKHGSVAIQVSNGMSGAFIVRGGALDAMTEELGMTERLIAIQKVDSSLNLVDNDLSPVTLVNGQYRPVIQMYPNEVQRWRIVNENITKTTNYRIGFVDDAGAPVMYDIARDGVSYSPDNYDLANPDTSLIMAPGNRLDVFVQAPVTLGRHHFRAVSIVERDPARQSRRTQLRLTTAGVAPADTLFTVEVVPGPPRVSRFPTRLPDLPAFLANLPGPIADTLALFADTASMPVVVFLDTGYHNRGLQTPPDFFLGTVQNPRMQFNDTLVYIPETSAGVADTMRLGGVQTWRVVNQGISTNHPFHIHINPFQVVYVHAPNPTDKNAPLYAQLNAAAQRNAPIWQDVVPLPLPRDTANPSADPGYVIIRQRYDDFTGQYVIHCHILGHEERGMMQLLEVYGSGAPAARSRSGGHDHH